MKCIDEEVPFEIPKGWEWTRVGNIFWVTKLAGFEYTKYFTKDAISSFNTVPIVRAQNVRTGRFEENNNEAISLTLSKQLERSSLTKKCLLMTFIGAGIGDVCIFHASKRNHLAPNVAKIEPFNNDCFLDYYLIALMSPLGQYGVESIKKSTAQPSLSMETIRHLLIPVPSLAEQKRIVIKWDALYPLIDKYNKEYIEYDKLSTNVYISLRKSILQEAIQGKLVPQKAEEGTAKELLKQIHMEKQKLVKEGKLKKSAINSSVIFRGDDNKYYEKIGKNCVDITEELPFDLPNNWTWCRLGNLVSITSGENLTSKQMHNGKIPVYGGNGITGYHSKANIFEETIVIGRVGYYCGSIHLTPCQAWVTDNAFITQYSKLLNRDFLIYLLTALNLGKCCNATAQPVVSGKKIYPLLIALPPFKEQQRIVAQIEKLFEQLH